MRDEYLPLAIVLLLVAFVLLLPAKYDPMWWLAHWIDRRGRKK
jgi:hypothetical protein